MSPNNPDPGSPVCGEGDYPEIRPAPGLRIIAEQDGDVELLYPAGQDRPSLARVRSREHGRFQYLAVDRLVAGGSLLADEKDPFMTQGFLPDISIDFLDALAALSRPLGPGAYVLSFKDLSPEKQQQFLPMLGENEQAAFDQAPGLAALSELRRALRLDDPASLPQEALFAVPDRLVSLGPPLTAGYPSGESADAPWPLESTGARRAHEAGHLGAAEILVAVIDSGIRSHPGLGCINWAAAMDCHDPNDVRVADASNLVDGIGKDLEGHGTNVAGTIASADAGIAPRTCLLPIRAFAGGCAWTAGIAKGIEHAASSGARVVAAAWALDFDDPLIYHAMSRATKILFVTPAGDTQRLDLTNACFYPARWRPQLTNLLVVGGVSKSDRWSSNYGASIVDFGAPAVSIKSTVLGPTEYYIFPGSNTSLAVGLAAGAAALLLALAPDEEPQSIRDALHQGTRKVEAFAHCCISAGVLDIGKVLLGIGHPGPVNGSAVGCPP